MSGVSGQDAVVRMMVTYRQGIRPTLLSVMNTAAIDIAGYIKESKLSGQVLNVRSGRLRRSVSPSVRESGSEVSAVTSAGGTNVRYARPHEYGFQGTVNVPAHQRMQTMAFGHPMDKLVEVRAHPMKMNLPERSFMRTGLREKAPVEIERIRGAMLALKDSAQL